MNYEECDSIGTALAEQRLAELDNNEITPDLVTRAEALYKERFEIKFDRNYTSCDESLEATQHQIEVEFYLHMWFSLKKAMPK